MIHKTKSDADSKEMVHDKIILEKKFLNKFLWNLLNPITIIQEMYVLTEVIVTHIICIFRISTSR